MKELLNVSTREEFADNEEVAALSARAHEEADIGMENSAV